MARTPLYLKAETEMRRRIADGDWPVGMRLGNEFQLADEFRVSQGTMRRALITLEQEGLLSRKPGRGTLVAAPRPMKSSATGALSGPNGPAEFEVHRSRLSTRRPNADEVALLGQDKVHHLERLLKLDGDRAALEEMIVSADAVPAMQEDAAIDLVDALAAQGVKDVSVEDEIRAEMTSMGDSVALSCDRNTALLCLTRTARNTSGDVIARQVLRISEPKVSYA
ncbi:MAG: GntR family transcriptional regulator [Pseudomonadota bacterium]